MSPALGQWTLRLSGIFALLLALGICATVANAQDERILGYHSDIVILPDGSLEVSEQIKVRSLQQNIRRGIYRDFPTRYRDRFGNRVRIDFEVVEVLRDGRPEPWFTERVSNGIRVNTGNDDFLPGPGNYTFTIRYRTQRQLGFFENHDELYWNVTGLGWAFPIDRASAQVTLPEPVPAEELELNAFTGALGSTERRARTSIPAPGQVRFETIDPLGMREGLTIVVGFPKGIVEEPTRGDRIAWLLRDNRGLIVMLLGLIGVTVYYWRAWYRHGRGPAAGVIVARYEPPADHAPSGLRYVLREGYDQRGFMADLVAMAVLGLVTIEREDRLLGDTWTLKRTDKPLPDGIDQSQKALINTLFAEGPVFELKKGSATASRMQSAISAHKLAVDGRYKGEYIKPNYGILWKGGLASIAVTILAFVLADGAGTTALVVGMMILALVNLPFAMIMSAPTEKGRALRDEVEGLQRYLTVAEKDDLGRLEQRDPNEPAMNAERFERLLPYAMALKVEDAWTDKLTAAVGAAAAAEATRRMVWYGGSGAPTDSLSAMSSSLSQGLSSSISSAATPPGSSSGGGGGGFSGGGGGGGGGGGR